MSIQVYYDLPGNSISRNCGNKVRIKERKENFLKNFPVRRFRGKEPQPPAAGCGTGKYAAAVNVREASDHHEFYTTGSCGVYRLRTGYTLVCHTDLRRNSPGRFSGSEEGAVSRDFTGRPAGYHTRFRACGNRRCTPLVCTFQLGILSQLLRCDQYPRRRSCDTRRPYFRSGDGGSDVPEEAMQSS